MSMIKLTSHQRLSFRTLAIVSAVAGLNLAVPQASAASSEWVETEGGRIRMSALPPGSDGTIKAVLDVDLLPGWKTYWRDPGEAGVPPTLGFSGSENIEQAEIHFPAPERIKDDYSVWAGYKYPVTFPVSLVQKNAGAASTLQADVFLGICQSICIPFQTNFTLTVDPDVAATPFEEKLINHAFNDLPEASGEGFEITGFKHHEGVDALDLTIQVPSSASKSELFVTGPQGWYFETPKLVHHDGDLATFEISIDTGSQDAALAGNAIQVLVTSAGRSMETEFLIP